MCVNAAKQGHRLRFKAAQGKRSKLHNSRLRTGSGGLCIKNLEALPVRYQVHHLHRSQELATHIQSEGAKHETTKMGRIAKRL